MYKYKYKAFLNRAWTVGYISANNRIEATEIIRNTFHRIIYVKRCWFTRPNKQSNVIGWLDTLSLLMKGGIKIEEALQVMSGHKGYEFSSGILHLIRSGKSFQEVLSLYGFFFDDQTLLMIKALLRTISIEEACDFIAKYKARIYEKYSAIKRSLMQPCMTLVLTILLCFGLILLLKDTIQSVFLDMGLLVPSIIVYINELTFSKVMTFIATIILLVIFALRNLERFPFSREILVDRDLFISFQFIGYGLKNGLTIIEAIEVSSLGLRTCYVKNLMGKLKGDIMRGSSAFSSLDSAGINQIYLNIIRVNELAGNIAQGFISAAQAADRNLHRRLSLLVKLVPSGVTIVTALLVIGFLNSFILPMYECVTTTLS